MNFIKIGDILELFILLLINVIVASFTNTIIVNTFSQYKFSMALLSILQSKKKRKEGERLMLAKLWKNNSDHITFINLRNLIRDE